MVNKQFWTCLGQFSQEVKFYIPLPKATSKGTNGRREVSMLPNIYLSTTHVSIRPAHERPTMVEMDKEPSPATRYGTMADFVYSPRRSKISWKAQHLEHRQGARERLLTEPEAGVHSLGFSAASCWISRAPFWRRLNRPVGFYSFLFFFSVFSLVNSFRESLCSQVSGRGQAPAPHGATRFSPMLVNTSDSNAYCNAY